jgi:ADP-ribose pyrophosphatase YjhB (NUDIX family)
MTVPPGSYIGCFNVIPHPDSEANPDSYLLCQETAQHKAGLLNLLGGGFERGIDKIITNCASREAREEGGGKLEVQWIGGIGLYEYPNPDQHRLHIIVASDLLKGEPAPSKEHPVVDFFSFEEIKAMDRAGQLRGPAVLRSIDFHRRGMIISKEQFLTTIPEDKTSRLRSRPQPRPKNRPGSKTRAPRSKKK